MVFLKCKTDISNHQRFYSVIQDIRPFINNQLPYLLAIRLKLKILKKNLKQTQESRKQLREIHLRLLRAIIAKSRASKIHLRWRPL